MASQGGDSVPPTSSAPSSSQPQLGRRDSIPLSQPGMMMEMTERASVNPARINPNTFAINQVYSSDNPMHD